MTEELFWRRVFNLWTFYHSITDDLVYKAMWKRKLKELMDKELISKEEYDKRRAEILNEI